jgi:drug/metabolite transporter (DMT)-like permease
MFGAASVVFSDFSRRTNALWMNAFKGFIAFFCFACVAILPSSWEVLPSWTVVGTLLLSGFIGLNLGDNFLVEAFRRIGAARTLMIFSFQPLLISLGAHWFLGEGLEIQKMYAIVMLILCALVVSFERYRVEGRWELLGPLIALAGMMLDACGILLTRYSFEATPGLSSPAANFIRCLGAVIGFVIIFSFRPQNLWAGFKKFDRKSRGLLLAASVAGTFFSLWLYLKAIDLGPLAPVTAIAGCVPIFSAVFECIYHRRKPSAYLIIGLAFFSVGLWMLTGL